MSDRNVHAADLREARPPQAGPSVAVPDLFRLDNRTIVVTGASGFLGTEVAKAIIQSGGNVIALDLESPPPAFNKELDDLVSTDKTRFTYLQCDITDEADVTGVFDSIVSLGLNQPIRGLVCCAGISDNGPAIDFPASSFRRLLDVNVTGNFLVAKAVANDMKNSYMKGMDVSGSIVFVASMSGYVSNKGVDTAGYNSSKAAVQQLARSLAAEWGSRVGMPLIRVNSLSPGYVRTAATAEALQKPGMESQWVGDNMLYRLSTADEFRAPVLFLLSDGSSFMTGADLRVDGGHCAW